MPQAITIVDAFTEKRFRGNPAAICILETAATEAWMRDLACEMNLSETAYIVPRASAGDFDLRWFTPVAEVDLCGHATLAAAHVLWEQGLRDRADDIAFHTRSGVLTASTGDGKIWLDFPAERPEAAALPGLGEALGVEAAWLGRNRMDLFVAVDDDAAVLDLTPNFSALAGFETRGVIVTARACEATRAVAGEVDFVSRFFAPRHGINEDPVTGSAHCALAPYWAEKLGRADLKGYQASSRGGHVATRVAGGRVAIGGQAVTTLRGSLA